MKINKKHVKFTNGFIHFKNGFEINWSIDDWGLPFAIQNTYYVIFFQFLCLSFIIPKNISIDNNFDVGWPCSPRLFMFYMLLIVFFLYVLMF